MHSHPSELTAVARELAELAGARVETVRVHAERALTVELSGRGAPATILLSAEPGRARFHAARRRPPQPPSPYAWQSVLRRELESARLEAVEASPQREVVELRFAGAAGPLRLVAELRGPAGNLFLVDGEGLVRASAARPSADGRELSAGKPYSPPEPRAGGAGCDAALAEMEGEAAAGGGARFPFSAGLEERGRDDDEARELALARRRLREPARAALARSRRALAKLAEEAERVPAAEEDRRRADLLKTNLHAVKRGAREALLTEWTEEGPREVRIALDPALPPRQSMERYYRRYRRIVESAARVAERTAEVRRKEGELVALLAAVDAAPLAELPVLEREARRLGAAPRPPPRPRSKRDEPLPPFRLYRSAAGVALLVGRGAAENDALTVRHARGNDLWLHARGHTGAHVVAKLAKGALPDGETLLDAAHLAAHFSDARGEVQVEVVATRAKYVRKPKGAAPGAVTYSQERTLLVRVEAGRVERLLASEEHEDG